MFEISDESKDFPGEATTIISNLQPAVPCVSGDRASLLVTHGEMWRCERCTERPNFQMFVESGVQALSPVHMKWVALRGCVILWLYKV